MVATSLGGRTYEFGWYDAITRENIQYDCKNCGYSKVIDMIVGVNEKFECIYPTTCEANGNIDNCDRCRPIDKMYRDAMKQ